MLTQISASLKYQVIRTSEEELDYRFPLDTTQATDNSDFDLVDLPRFHCVRDTIKALAPDSLENPQTVTVLCVTLRRQIPGHLKNPHFLLLKDPAPSQDFHTSFFCTCGSSVRAGIPCRHFWAAMNSDFAHLLAFHFGQVNDQWFKQAQVQAEVDENLYCMGHYEHQFSYRRPLYVAATAKASAAGGPQPPVDAETPAVNDLRQRFGRVRAHGELLGICKKAVEAALCEGKEDALRAVLQTFVPGAAESSHSLCVNPAVAKTKGRPTGSRNKENLAPAQRAMFHLPKRKAPERDDAPRLARRCSHCRETGHNMRCCPNLATQFPSTPAMPSQEQPVATSTPLPPLEG